MSSRPDTKSRALLGTIAAIALPILAVVALHRLGSLEWLRIDFGDLDGWARRSRVEDALAAVLRYVALIGGYWLSISSIAYLLARLSGVTRLIDATAVFTLPAVRRVTDRLVVGALAVSTLAGPAIAVNQWADEPVVVTVDPIQARLGEDVTDNGAAVIDLTALRNEKAESPAPEEAPPAAAEASPPTTISIRADAHLEVIVTEGDHLWALAERRMSSVLGRQAADHEIAPYWREVISSNPDLRSGNPDLIYPGEVIVLPPVD